MIRDGQGRFARLFEYNLAEVFCAAPAVQAEPTGNPSVTGGNFSQGSASLFGISGCYAVD